LTNNTSFPKQCSNSENQISSGSLRWKLSSQFEADNLGQDHRDLLSEHDGLSFDTADTPSDDSETINHGGVTVGTNDRVGVKNTVLFEDDWSEPFKINLVNNTVAWRHDSQVVECLFTPLEESESLLVADELKLFILFFGVGLSCNIDLN
jgi:hypothetical protein